jgi:hypothetical protein
MKLFTEWMSFRQTGEAASSDFQFAGTYNTETIPDLQENSEIVDVKEILEQIPANYKIQFSETANLSAGKSMNEKNKELIWISIEDNGITYLFEKN